MSMQLTCTSKNIWAELSYEFGPSCLINLGRWHGPSFMWAELVLGRVVRNSDRHPMFQKLLLVLNIIGFRALFSFPLV